MDADGRAWRNRRRLSISRAAGQQGQDCCDRKDSADFHGNLPSSNGIRRPTHRMTTSEARLSRKRTPAAKLANGGSEALVLFCPNTS